MFGEKFRRRYVLSDSGVLNAKKGTFWTVVVNLVVMCGLGILYLLMKAFMDTYLSGAPLPGIVPYLLSIVIFIIISYFVHLNQYHNTYTVVYKEVSALRISLAEKLRKLPLSYFGRRDLSDLTETIMGDVNRLEHVWSHVVGYLYGAYISTAIVAVMLALINFRLMIASLWGVPVAFLLLYGSRSVTRKASEEMKKAALKVSDDIQVILDNMREIRATNNEEIFLGTLDRDITAHENIMKKGEIFSGIFVNAASIIMRLGIATTILVGASLIINGEIDFMTFFLFLLVILRIYAPFDQALALIAEVFFSEVSAERLYEIFDTPSETGGGEFHPAGHDVVFDDVSFAYGDEAVLKSVSFTAREGEVTALVGPSGSGKSTAAKLAARLWDIGSGCITVGGVDILSVDPEVLHRDYSMVFQDVTLFDDTVMGNIRLGKRSASDEEVLAAARAAGCDEFAEKLPLGYDTPIGENGARLSGGERQRISIARALLKDAPIVLLDEASSSLDVENETKVQNALSRLLEGKTVIVIAHRMRTVEAADKIIVLSEGRKVEEGSPEELTKREDSVFRHMRELQKLSQEWSV